MPYRTMSLDEFAKHVRMDAREVRKLADRGKLPGVKAGGEWRFNRARVTEWLQQEIHTLDQPRLVEIERAMSGPSSDTDVDHGFVVTELIGLEGIDPLLPARTKKSAMRELVALAGRTGLLYDAAGLLEAVEQREAMCSTALVHGVAIPHPRQPMPYVSAEPLICVGKVPGGIAFGGQDRELTRLFFLICCHDDRHHLRVLARLMRILMDGEVVEPVMVAENPADILQILIEREQEVISELL